MTTNHPGNQSVDQSINQLSSGQSELVSGLISSGRFEGLGRRSREGCGVSLQRARPDPPPSPGARSPTRALTGSRSSKLAEESWATASGETTGFEGLISWEVSRVGGENAAENKRDLILWF